MTDDPKAKKAKRDPATEQAKGAAREAIGKLIGDDAEVHAGRRQQADPKSSSQE